MADAMAAGRPGEVEGQNIGLSPNQIAEAYRASIYEHKMKFSTAFRTHKKALLWSAIMGLVRLCIFSLSRP